MLDCTEPPATLHHPPPQPRPPYQVDPGEVPEAALVRELQEELSIEVRVPLVAAPAVGSRRPHTSFAFCWSVPWTIPRPTNLQTNQAPNPTPNEPTNQPTNPTPQPTNLTNQPNHPPTNQPQPTNPTQTGQPSRPEAPHIRIALLRLIPPPHAALHVQPVGGGAPGCRGPGARLGAGG